jgi:hypothetical protein
MDDASLGRMKVIDLEANPEEKESKVEHWEVRKEDATVKPVEALKNRHRGQHLTVGRHGKLKEWTKGKDVYQKKLTATTER